MQTIKDIVLLIAQVSLHHCITRYFILSHYLTHATQMQATSFIQSKNKNKCERILPPNSQSSISFLQKLPDKFFGDSLEQVFPNLAPDAPPEEELTVRESRYCGVLKSGHTRFMIPLCERRDVLSAADYLILFQNLDEILKLSEEIRDEGGGIDSYLCRVPKITAAYRRYLSGLQRACCLLVALRRNTAFAKLVCEPAVPHKRRPDLTGVLLLPLEHYRLARYANCLRFQLGIFLSLFFDRTEGAS